ncbi:MAG: hypothetical protein ACI9FD_003903 [Gammaproteobacteria bacterium]|jgi:hypothetical protein
MKTLKHSKFQLTRLFVGISLVVGSSTFGITHAGDTEVHSVEGNSIPGIPPPKPTLKNLNLKVKTI